LFVAVYQLQLLAEATVDSNADMWTTGFECSAVPEFTLTWTRKPSIQFNLAHVARN